MDIKINYSIIIPHKNIPGLLQRCLSSIPHRRDVQIVVIDDNSDPDKVDFKQFPGLNDSFVEIYYLKENKGKGFALNLGLTKAVGKWLLFADADDFYNYCINDILDEYVNSNHDIIFFKHNSIDSSLYTEKKRMMHYNAYIDNWINSKKAKVKIKADSALRKCPLNWSRLYKAELIKKNEILFDNVSIAIDVTFGYLTGYYAVSIFADPRALYTTTVREGSIRHQKITDEKQLDLLYIMFKRYKFFSMHNKYYTIPKEINIVYRYYFTNKMYFDKSMDILHKLGYSSNEIRRLVILSILFCAPKNKFLKLFSNLKKIASKLWSTS